MDASASSVSLRAPSALSLGVAPEYRLDNATRNETGLQVDGKVNVTATELPEEQAKEALELIDLIEQDEDVQKVYHTLA